MKKYNRKSFVIFRAQNNLLLLEKTKIMNSSLYEAEEHALRAYNIIL